MLAEKNSAEVVLARLLGVDLLPMYKLEKSKDIQNNWAAQGFKTPTARKPWKRCFFHSPTRPRQFLSKNWLRK